MRKFTEADVSKLLEGMVSSRHGEEPQRLAEAGEVRDITEFAELRTEAVVLPANEQALVRRALAKFELNKDDQGAIDRITLVSIGRLYAPIVYMRVSFQISYTIEVGRRVSKQRLDSNGNVENYTETDYHTVTGQAADTVNFALEASYEKPLNDYHRIAYFDSVPRPNPAKPGYVYPHVGEAELARRERKEMEDEIYRFVVLRLFRNQDTRGFSWAGSIRRESIKLAHVMMLKVVYDVDGKRRRDALMNETNYREVAGKNRRGCFGVMLVGLVASGAAFAWGLTHLV